MEYSLEKEWRSLSASECPFFKELNRGQYIFEWCSLVFTLTLFSLFFEWKISLFSHFSLFRVDNSCFWVVFTLFRVNSHSLVFSLFLHLESIYVWFFFSKILERLLREYCTPNLKLACFVCYLKIININIFFFFEK